MPLLLLAVQIGVDLVRIARGRSNCFVLVICDVQTMSKSKWSTQESKIQITRATKKGTSPDDLGQSRNRMEQDLGRTWAGPGPAHKPPGTPERPGVLRRILGS
ncbi:hypothetical protein B0T25DRAFT_148802 [Lasiosphaeria hispida]|uniref:Uncharacterized protein n=1 Tax=Lasiosphaeria hispida TaxID=260671 RepID=A0AAJ0HLL2_9PEZI|nr:hypothetical protein B0T25DRAFT_148802 [Lasiosphaeria hispida]